MNLEEFEEVLSNKILDYKDYLRDVVYSKEELEEQDFDYSFWMEDFITWLQFK